MGRNRLSDDEVRGAIEDHPEWSLVGGALTATFPFESYEAGVAFAMRLALYAQRVDHHPELLIAWGRVTVTWSTHDAGGVTRHDVEGARYASTHARA